MLTAPPPPGSMKPLLEPSETSELAETETSESVRRPAWLRRNVLELSPTAGVRARGTQVRMAGWEGWAVAIFLLSLLSRLSQQWSLLF